MDCGPGEGAGAKLAFGYSARWDGWWREEEERGSWSLRSWWSFLIWGGRFARAGSRAGSGMAVEVAAEGAPVSVGEDDAEADAGAGGGERPAASI